MTTKVKYFVKRFQVRYPSCKEAVGKLTCKDLFLLFKEVKNLEGLAKKLRVNRQTLSTVIHKRVEECFYSTPEYAKLLGTHPEKVRKQIREGKIPAVFYGNRFLIPKPFLVTKR